MLTSIDTKDQYFESVRLKNTLPFSVLAFARHTVESVRSRNNFTKPRIIQMGYIFITICMV